MEDLISRQAAIDAIDEYIEKNRRPDFIGNMVWVSGVADAMRIVSDLPPVQERKNGRWLNHLGLPLNDFCSVCAKDSPYNKHWKYCPNCGAHMEGAEDARRNERCNADL